MKKEEKLEIIELLKNEVTEDLGIKILSEKFNCSIKYPFSWLKERCVKKNIYRDDIIGYFIFFKVQNWEFRFYFKIQGKKNSLRFFLQSIGIIPSSGKVIATEFISQKTLNEADFINTFEKTSYVSGFHYSNNVIRKK